MVGNKSKNISLGGYTAQLLNHGNSFMKSQIESIEIKSLNEKEAKI
jgi:hypothetical protein